MSLICMNTRCQKIMKLLLMGEGHISLKKIADEVNVSRRSIYYDLCKINEWLTENNIPELEVTRGKGILVTEEEKKQIMDVFNTVKGEEPYSYSPTERVKIIICYIIHMGDPVFVDTLSDCCQVSRNTIFNDMRAVVSTLQKYNLKLTYENKKGYCIEGDVIQTRALYFLYFNYLMPLFNSGVLNFVNVDEIKNFYLILKNIEKELNIKYVDGVLLSLAALLPLMYKSHEKPFFEKFKVDEIQKTKEFQLVQKNFKDLQECEQVYLCLHLLGSRVAKFNSELFETESNQSVYELSKALVSEFEKKACIFFSDRESLERALFIHISSSMYRYRYGIQIGNPICEDVMREYPNLFDITKYVCKYLSRIVGLPIPESEVAYLALHFGAHLRISQNNQKKLRVLIVCANGVSAGNMLKREVQKLLPNAVIVDVVAAADATNPMNTCDLIISTIKFESEVPVVVVHPILSNLDRQIILSHQEKNLMEETDFQKQLFELVKKYIHKEDYESLKKDIKKFLEPEIKTKKISTDANKKGLVAFLEKGTDKIQILDEKMTWSEAVMKAGQTLQKSGGIEKRYLKSIVSEIQYYGPYMFTNKGLLLAHAKPEDGVNSLDVAMTVLKQPVQFSECQEANIIITLAAEDQEKHLGILKDIVSIFADEKKHSIEKIVAMNSPQQILDYIREEVSRK